MISFLLVFCSMGGLKMITSLNESTNVLHLCFFVKNLPNTKLSGLKICPNGPDLTESMVPGSKSTRTARGTYLPPEIPD